jgi:3-dehydroquinate dehydratase-2
MGGEHAMQRILLVQGANLVYLGKREQEFYGTTTPDELDSMVQGHAKTKGYALDIFYTNIEGEAINRIYQSAESGVDGLVMNPAGFSYVGYALKDCIKGTGLPYVEVHISNIEKRGIPSVLASVATGVIYGFGIYSYILGLEAILNILDNDVKR